VEPTPAVHHFHEPEPRPTEPAEVIAPIPAKPTIPPVPPTAFHAVSEHDEAAAADSHRPVRRRPRHAGEGEPQPAALQLVETQAETPPVVAEDESPRRTKPRRRRGGPAPSEPLKLVETQPGAEAARPDNPA
jgi:hypothetical protein